MEIHFSRKLKAQPSCQVNHAYASLAAITKTTETNHEPETNLIQCPKNCIQFEWELSKHLFQLIPCRSKHAKANYHRRIARINFNGNCYAVVPVIDDSPVVFTAATAAVLRCMKYLITESKQFGVKNKLHTDSSARHCAAKDSPSPQDTHLNVTDCFDRVCGLHHKCENEIYNNLLEITCN